ncbi:MAG: DDE-type integrase/transposase/recombinase [Armatimonadetes bacterium]|nr:DDE-type integrase/transposase/recombinase [Armatimonadota bacterium]
MDLCSRQLIGWAIDDTLAHTLVFDALQMALKTRHPSADLRHHSDRGEQYAYADYQRVLATYGIQVSRSRAGNGWDNAPMERFMATLKTEWVHHRHDATRAQARQDLFKYMETFDNRQRLLR